MSFAAVIERLQKLENPYPGLRPFETHESHLFFGRDQQVADLVSRLEGHRFLAVVGVSGSGKSSLVRAGLLPALERGRVLEAGQRWRIVVTRPGGAPFDSLAADLAKAGLDASRLKESSHGLVETARQLGPEESLLVVVDQFEELFRYKDLQPITENAKRRHAAAAADAAEFVQLLLAASRHFPPVYVVLTMRSDYLGDCAEFRDLPETLNDCQYLVPRLTREQRKEAIERPLGRVEIAPSLVQRMLNDAGDEPDQLPVLQHALMRTWHHWRQRDPDRKGRIELEDYTEVGGFGGALNQHADQLLAGVTRSRAETIFKRLTARGRGSRERRDPARLAELWAVCGAVTAEQRAEVTAVIDHFRRGDATFLSPLGIAIGPDSYIDITHESLIRQWQQLRDEWLPDEQRSAKTFLDVAGRAANWKAGQGELLAGLDLTGIVEWDCRRNKTAAWAEHYADEATLRQVDEFVATSVAEARARVLRVRTGWAAAITVALVAAAVALYRWQAHLNDAVHIANREREQAETASRSAESLLAKRSSETSVGSTITPPPDVPPAPTPAPAPPPTTPTTQDPPPATPPDTKVPVQPEVYIQVRNTVDADQAKKMLNQALRRAGFLVPAPEVLPVGPKATEVRFFRQAEREEAQRVLGILQQAGFGDAQVQYVAGYEDSKRIRQHHLEVWLSPDAKGSATHRLRWPYYDFPPPNAGRLVFTTMPDGNPACASYNGGGCLWGLTYDQIEFSRLQPLVCGEQHKARWGVTGYDDPKHWCSMARTVNANPS